MKLKEIIISVVMVSLSTSIAYGQAVVDSTGIYIKQTNEVSSELPLDGIAISSELFSTYDSLESFTLNYSEQDMRVRISSNEDLQWGNRGVIEESESLDIENVTDGQPRVAGNRSGRLAELLGNIIGSQQANSEDEDSEPRESNAADKETMDAFRAAFEAVMREDNTIADDSTSGDVSESVSIELSAINGNVKGIVLDETRSKTGRDFYNAFYNAWSELEGLENSVVRVAEKPGPGMASVMFVEVNYEEIFALRLLPGDQRTIQAGEVAAARTLSHLKENTNTLLTY